MTALPACLPAGIAACMVAAGVCGDDGAASYPAVKSLRR